MGLLLIAPVLSECTTRMSRTIEAAEPLTGYDDDDAGSTTDASSYSTTRDPRVYGAVALLILVVALLASALPTLRATRANPLDALRIAQ
jgi:ABC-type lipoprotein release transport system permease subunit